MAFSREKLRELVFLLLYVQDFDSESEDPKPMIMRTLKVSKTFIETAKVRAQDIQSHNKEIEELIRSASDKYPLGRISRVEKNVLKLAIYEMVYDKDLADAIVISEAVRLVRKFSTPEASAFVNAILDHVLQNLSHAQNTEHSTACIS